ncbi:MAG: hypothetical protein WCK96_15580 [Methylococcales bacterium]
MSNRIPTIVNGTRYEALTEAMETSGFNKRGEKFWHHHRQIKKHLKEAENDAGNDVAFTLGN